MLGTVSEKYFKDNFQYFVPSSATEMMVMRIYKFWLHNDFFYKRSIYSRVYNDLYSKSSLKYAQIIIDKIRKEQEIESIDDNEKPKTFIRALINKKNCLSDEEISDEIKTMLVAVNYSISMFNNFLKFKFIIGTRHNCTFSVNNSSSFGDEQRCSG